MPNIEIKHLFKLKRFPDNEVKILCFVLYVPLGLILFVLRSILATSVVLIGCTLSDSATIHKLVNKVSCLALGITVTIENPDKKENVDVYISNSLSIFDHLAVHAAAGSVMPVNSSIHPALSRGLGLHYFGNQINLDAFKRNITEVVTEKHIPVHFTPEDKITNGKAILKFKTFPFTIANKVQPVCIRAERPFLDLSVTTLGSSYWTDVLCYMFSPFTNYKLRFLTPLEKKSLPDVDFAEIVRQNIASELKVETPELTAADLLEWEKRQLAEPPPRPVASSQASVIDPDVRRMAQQVKEVLPHVPLSAICRDLNKTRNVDNTITNILEGRINFVPELPSQPASSDAPSGSTSVQSPKSTTSGAAPSDLLFNTAASTFAKSAHERTRSFHDRKEQLIANARKRYIEKHNMNLSV